MNALRTPSLRHCRNLFGETSMTSSRHIVRAAFLAIAFTLTTAGLVFSSPCAAQAEQDSFSAGQHLSKEQVTALGALQRVEIDARPYLVLRTGTSTNGLPITTLIDRRGTVGQTYHELVISGEPTATVRLKAGALLAPAADLNYYDHTGITVARFPTLEQAVTALAQVRAALPGAEVGLPIAFDRPRLQ